MIPGLTVGRIVHYVLAESDLPESHKHAAGQIRPAMIVNDWPGLGREDGYSNLLVFVDGSNDIGGDYKERGSFIWATSRVLDYMCKPGTWHWPNKKSALA